MADAVEITIKKDGPYVVSGVVTLIDTEGTPYTDLKPIIALCRCTHSKNRPFCDGSHTSCGFIGEDRVS